MYVLHCSICAIIQSQGQGGECRARSQLPCLGSTATDIFIPRTQVDPELLAIDKVDAGLAAIVEFPTVGSMQHTYKLCYPKEKVDSVLLATVESQTVRFQRHMHTAIHSEEQVDREHLTIVEFSAFRSSQP